MDNKYNMHLNSLLNEPLIFKQKLNFIFLCQFIALYNFLRETSKKTLFCIFLLIANAVLDHLSPTKSPKTIFWPFLRIYTNKIVRIKIILHCMI